MPYNPTRIGMLIRRGLKDKARRELLAAARKSGKRSRQAFAKEQGYTRSTLHRWCGVLECNAAFDEALLPAVT